MECEKGWEIACFAFDQAFGDSKNHRLIIKAREGFPLDLENENITVLEGNFSEAQLQDLYSRCHAYVFPTHGEGFGLPPREAAATGMPVLATNWGGTADDLAQWGYPIKHKLVPAWKGHAKFEGLGKWAEPDIDHLVKQMRWVADLKRFKMWHMQPHGNQDERVANKVRRLYDWRKFSESILEVWRGIASKPTPPKSDRRKRRKAVRNGN